MINIVDLKKSYGALPVIHGITTTIERGDVVSVIGPSGTGKSTFLRCLNLLERPDAGRIEFEGVDLTGRRADLNAMRRKIGMVFQNFHLFAHMTVLENLTFGQVKLLGIPRAEADAHARTLLQTVGLLQKEACFPHELSGGQKQRVAIARCLSMRPEIILFDEPTSALDPTMVGEVTAVMKNLAQSGMTMVIVTHELEFARQVSTRVMYMDEGGIYEDGAPDHMFGDAAREKTRAFIHQIKSFRHAISDAAFDFIALMNELRTFCARHYLSLAETDRIALMAEELIALLPKEQGTEIQIDFPGDHAYFLLTAVYGGTARDITQTDDFSGAILRKYAKQQTHTYTDRNKLTLMW